MCGDILAAFRFELRGLAVPETRNLCSFRLKEASPVPIISECCEPGCVTLTIGEYCIEHEHGVADEPTLRESSETISPEFAFDHSREPKVRSLD